MKRAREGAEDGERTLWLVKQLRRESGDGFSAAARALRTILQNILEHPGEERYRTIRLSNSAFHARLGQYTAARALLQLFGFEPAHEDGAASPTHLALPVADAHALAQGLVLIEAAMQAASLVDSGAPCHDDGDPADADEAEPELVIEDCSATGIDSFFRTLVGEEGSEIGHLDLGTFGRVYNTGRSTHELVTALGDTAAADSVTKWLSLLDDHGARLGWFANEREGGDASSHQGRENNVSAACSGCAASSSNGGTASSSSGGAGSSIDVVGSSNGSGPSGGGKCPNDREMARGKARMEPHESMAAQVDTDQTIEVPDGNIDECVICQIGGLLVCCDACPRAYHAECLGDLAPPEDDEDNQWFCPTCASELGTSALRK